MFQVLVWKTNFDQVDYNEVLQSHRARSAGEPQPPTVQDIPPRSPKAARNSPGKVGRVYMVLLRYIELYILLRYEF